ncbi:iron-containing alcohol dehydrogenase family protein [Leptospira santarosai]|uniref:iron-containing alcohol dehydrogenase family protein n=1 Tax=Leptospira santarosai TaxID=28183 RepID=UPI0002F71870|nr:iron-containing alcohol dehydrogenase family protein [Leptospira santarosai]MDI7184858.1 iron-containing alcohol dehydrogenase family protein [Leptospira santarosai]MDI7201709.1 iron-containing alcohol dehydrogenase family protein [Leptospira santarosai]MDI7237705.1 iron-containing alcohol dehydrogenase family protein [Leptospira santarosai]UZN08554.1 iron-containing alcohol dehydrogenase family protein [Leptospira santarosai]
MTSLRIFKQVPRLLFGLNTIDRINELLPQKNNEDYYIFIIDDVHQKGTILNRLKCASEDIIEWFPASAKEPSTAQIDNLKDKFIQIRNQKLPRAIVGIGGGSTMDVAKALSVMMCNEGSASQYQGWDLVPNPGIFKIGIPTVAGSGAEASRTAVLMGKERKFGINSDYSMFDAIILDSSLIKNVPIDQRFYSGMDCYIHCVESLQGTMINELAKGNASKALELCEKVFLSDGDDDMLLTASYMGGVSIVNSEVGVCHALSYGLSLELGYRHGFANCVAFNVLEEYYGPWVDRFRKMLKIHKIELPKNVCKSLDNAAMDRMVNMTLKMERPLTNALGEDWKDKMTPNKIISLYERM